MKKFSKRLFAVVLSVLMVFSCFTTAFAEGLEYSVRGQSDFFNLSDNADTIGAAIDELLADTDIYVSVRALLADLLADENTPEGEEPALVGVIATAAPELVNLTLDLRSLSSVMSSVDAIKGILFTTVGTDTPIFAAVKAAVNLGDIANFKMSKWVTGRATASVHLQLRNLLDLINENSGLIGKVLDNTFNAGDLGFTAKDLFGEGGIKGMLKELLVSTVYEEGTAEYINACSKSVDDILFDIVLPAELAGEDDVLPGLVFDETTSFNALLIRLFNICWEKYLAPELEKLNLQYDADDALTMSFSNIVKLDFYDEATGTTSFVSEYTFDENKDFSAQLNNFLGFVVEQFIIDDDYEWTKSESSDVIGQNLKDAIIFILQNADFSGTEYADDVAAVLSGTPDFDKVMLLCLKVIVAEFAGDYNTAAVQAATTTQEIAKQVLINYVNGDLGLGLTYTATDDYLDVVSDLLAYAVRDSVPLYDLDGKEYTYGGGAELEDVLNYILTFYMFDLKYVSGGAIKTTGFASFGVDGCTRADSVFKKLDCIIAMLFDDEQTTHFNSQNFLFGEEGLLNSVFSLDIQNVLDITVIAALDAVQESSAVKVVYSAVENLLDNAFDAEILPEFTANDPFDNALDGANLKNLVINMLSVLSARVNTMFRSCYFLLAFVLGEEQYAAETDVSKMKVTVGNPLSETTITLGERTLVYGKDFVAEYAESDEGYVRIKGIGNYRGTYTVKYDISKADVEFDKDIYDYTGSAVMPAIAVTVDGQLLMNGVHYLADYRNNVNEGFGEVVVRGIGAFEGELVKRFYIGTIDKVTGIESTETTGTSIKLTWDAVDGAAGYRIQYKRTNADSWKDFGDVTKTTATIKSLSIGKTYNVRVKAFIVTEDGNKIYAEKYGTSVKVKTGPAKVSGLEASTNKTSYITIKWNEVENADRYEVYAVDAKGNYTRLTSTTGTSKKISDLTSNTEYKFAVRAYEDSSTYGKLFGSYSSTLTTRTTPKKVSGLEVEDKGSTWVELDWKNVDGAKYQVYYKTGSGDWTRARNNLSSSKYKITGLSANKTYKFKVRAYVKDDAGDTFYGSYSSEVSATTLLKKVSGLKLYSSSYPKTTSIRIKWSKVTGATEYQIYRSVGSSTNYKLYKTVTGTNFTDKSLKSGTVYNYKVRAVKGKTYGEFSSVLSVPTVPGKVSSVTVGTKRGTSIALSWTAVAGATGYEVYYSTSANGTYSKINATSTSATVSGLSRRTTYYFKVRAVVKADDATTYGAYSPVVSGATTLF